MRFVISFNKIIAMEGKATVDKVFKGTYIHAVTLGDIEVVQNGGIGVSSTGEIVFAVKNEEEFNAAIKQHNFGKAAFNAPAISFYQIFYSEKSK